MGLFTEEQAKFVKENVKGRTVKEITQLINERFGMKLNERQIRAYKKNHNLKSGVDGRFQKGHTPANKGKKGYSFGGVETQFKKGHKPHNYKPIGYERTDQDGYVLVKVSDHKDWHKRWKPKHRILWEEHNGPVPPGHALLFADGNKQNITLENLILVSREQMAVLNKKGLIHKDADLTKTGIVVADLYRKISERKRSKKKRK